jgi:hypothetical protein
MIMIFLQKFASLLIILMLSATAAYAENQKGSHSGGGHHAHAYNNAQFRNNAAPSISSSNYHVNNPNVPNNYNANNYNNNNYNRSRYNGNRYNNNGYNNNYNRRYNNNGGVYYGYPFVAVPYPVAVPQTVPESPDPDGDMNENPGATTQYPNGNWVSANNGYVPSNAVPYATSTDASSEAYGDNAADNYANNSNGNSNQNNTPSYYCRAVSNNQYVEGVLVPNDGCYVQNNAESSTTRYGNYQVLVNTN